MTTNHITRASMTPLIAEPGAKRALGLFAEGKINSLELQARLIAAAQKTNTATTVVREFCYRAVCAKFGLNAGGTGGTAQ